MSLFGLEAENVILDFLWLCDCLGFYRGFGGFVCFLRKDFLKKISHLAFKLYLGNQSSQFEIADKFSFDMLCLSFWKRSADECIM